jgi:L-lactate dehydrogenase complex protein LldG
MSARDNILDRVRDAMRVSAPRPEPPSDAAIWPPIGDLESQFRAEFAALKGEIVESLPEFLAGFKTIACSGNDLPCSGNVPVREAELGVTGCDCLVARTGSIVLTSRSAGGRALSILPPVHLVLARRSQIMLDLDAAIAVLRQRYNGQFPSMMSVVSGPSRTADIEKVLVMGAHGPKRLALHFIE